MEAQRNEIEALLDNPISFSRLSSSIAQIEEMIGYSLAHFGSGIGETPKDFVKLLLLYLDERRAEIEGEKEGTGRKTNPYEESTNLNQGS